MEAINLPVYDIEGKEIDRVEVDEAIFKDAVSSGAIYQAVNAYLANQRKGLASTKTRGEVSGGGKKPWKQKGTGRARVGSIRSPLWRHGGVIFGPHPRDFSQMLPKKIKQVALKSAFYEKIKANGITVLDKMELTESKTKIAAQIFRRLKVGAKDSSVLLLTVKIDPVVKRAVRNLSFLDFSLAKDTNVYQMLKATRVIITRDALGELVKRVKK